MAHCAMIEVSNLTKAKISTIGLKKLAEKVLRGEKNKRKDLSVVLVSPQRMRSFNKAYRGKDKAANVLSFSGEGPFLGEVVLCPSVIRKDAVQYGISFHRALSWMLAHGVLHLLGHTHKTMRKKEQYYLSRS